MLICTRGQTGSPGRTSRRLHQWPCSTARRHTDRRFRRLGDSRNDCPVPARKVPNATHQLLGVQAFEHGRAARKSIRLTAGLRADATPASAPIRPAGYGSTRPSAAGTRKSATHRRRGTQLVGDQLPGRLEARRCRVVRQRIHRAPKPNRRRHCIAGRQKSLRRRWIPPGSQTLVELRREVTNQGRLQRLSKIFAGQLRQQFGEGAVPTDGKAFPTASRLRRCRPGKTGGSAATDPPQLTRGCPGSPTTFTSLVLASREQTPCRYGWVEIARHSRCTSSALVSSASAGRNLLTSQSKGGICNKRCHQQ